MVWCWDLYACSWAVICQYSWCYQASMMIMIDLVSRSQTAFSSFIFGREEKGSGERPIQFLFSKSPLFGDFMSGFWLVLKGRKRSRGLWLGWQYRVITSLSPINEPFLSFNTNQKPLIKSPKSGDFENKNCIGHSPDPFSSCPNIKEEKAVWLRETMIDYKIVSSCTDYVTDYKICNILCLNK